jgi:hypothetical protein
MGAPDELSPALRARLEQLAAEGAEDLIREAQAEARAAIKARLRTESERALLEAVERAERPRPTPSRPEPAQEQQPAAEAAQPPRELGDGLWVYCVAGEGLQAPAAASVAPGRELGVVRAAGACALVSEVPLADFGEDGLKRNLNDLEWLERVARAHEEVLETALEQGALIPMRLCTIYNEENHVRAMLAERRSEFAEALERLAGRAEWGVKLVADRARLAERARARAAGAFSTAASEGVAYLGARQQDRRLRDEVDALLDEVVCESHARLEEWAAASELLPAQGRELAGYEGEMVLNGAYLVDDDRIERFREVLDELRGQYHETGLSFDLTGPWPAFHFAEGLESPGERVT